MRNFVSMLVLVLVLMAFLYFHDIRGTEKKEEAEKEASAILSTGIAAVDIKSIDWKVLGKGKDGEVNFKRWDVGWVATFPDKTQMRIKSSTMSELCHSLVNMNKMEKPDKKALAQYGLDKPLFSIDIHYEKDGQKLERGLILGDRAVDDSGSYALIKGQEDAVLEVPSQFISTLITPYNEMREDLLFSFSPARIKNMTYISKEGTNPGAFSLEVRQSSEPKGELEKDIYGEEIEDDKGSRWYVSTDAKKEFVLADVRKCNDFIWSWQNARITRFLPSSAKDKLGKIRAEYKFKVKDCKEELRVEIGQPVPGKPSQVYAHRNYPDEYFELDYSKVRDGAKLFFGKRGDEFVDRHIDIWDIEDVQRFTVEVLSNKKEGNYKVSASRINSGWKITSPSKLMENEAKRLEIVDKLLYDIAGIEWKEKVDNLEGKIVASAELYGEKDKDKNEKVLSSFKVYESKDGKTYFAKDAQGKCLILTADPRSKWIKACENLEKGVLVKQRSGLE